MIGVEVGGMRMIAAHVVGGDHALVFLEPIFARHLSINLYTSPSHLIEIHSPLNYVKSIQFDSKSSAATFLFLAGRLGQLSSFTICSLCVLDSQLLF